MKKAQVTESEFDSSERSTEPNRKEYRAARLVQLWNACSDTDKKTLERIAQWMAKDGQGEVEWD